MQIELTVLETINSGMTGRETPVSRAGTQLHHMMIVLCFIFWKGEGTVLWQECCLYFSWCVHSFWYLSLDSGADTASYPDWLKNSYLFEPLPRGWTATTHFSPSGSAWESPDQATACVLIPIM